jgi:hypothetical protein
MRRIIQTMMLAALICSTITGCASVSTGDTLPGEDTLLIFHNGTGPMCIEALAWLETMRTEHPDLVRRTPDY